MSDFKSIVKGGWHPKGKDGGKESWRGDFKGINQVAGWVGKGKQSDVQAANSHVSRPLATLKDPSSFGPPPKNVNYHGGAALPNEITPHRGGLGAPLTQAEIAEARIGTASPRLQEQEAPAKPAPPSLPYRANTTGLRTDNLPPPPVHRDLHQSSSPSTGQPKLPPRLPARQNTASTSPLATEAPPPSYEPVATRPAASSYINQSAANSLGRAGVSVPGFGIGSSEPNPWKDQQSQAPTTGSGQLSELQSRFARMKTPAQESQVPADPTSPSQSQSQSQSQGMPSWQQSQSAFQTAQNLRTNPQNVSMADAQSAAQTAGQAQRSASAFKEKHADSIAKGQARAKAFDQKYKFTSKINKFLDESSTDQNNATTAQTQSTQPNQYQQYEQSAQAYSAPPQLPQHPSTIQQPMQSPAIDMTATSSFTRKPPPPPAPRKPANLQAPPPVPTGTKPTFG